MVCPSNLEAPGTQTLSGQTDVSFTVEESGSLILELFETYDDIGNRWGWRADMRVSGWAGREEWRASEVGGRR